MIDHSKIISAQLITEIPTVTAQRIIFQKLIVHSKLKTLAHRQAIAVGNTDSIYIAIIL